MSDLVFEAPLATFELEDYPEDEDGAQDNCATTMGGFSYDKKDRIFEEMVLLNNAKNNNNDVGMFDDYTANLRNKNLNELVNQTKIGQTDLFAKLSQINSLQDKNCNYVKDDLYWRRRLTNPFIDDDVEDPDWLKNECTTHFTTGDWSTDIIINRMAVSDSTKCRSTVDSLIHDWKNDGKNWDGSVDSGIDLDHNNQDPDAAQRSYLLGMDLNFTGSLADSLEDLVNTFEERLDSSLKNFNEQIQLFATGKESSTDDAGIDPFADRRVKIEIKDEYSSSEDEDDETVEFPEFKSTQDGGDDNAADDDLVSRETIGSETRSTIDHRYDDIQFADEGADADPVVQQNWVTVGNEVDEDSDQEEDAALCDDDDDDVEYDDNYIDFDNNHDDSDNSDDGMERDEEDEDGEGDEEEEHIYVNLSDVCHLDPIVTADDVIEELEEMMIDENENDACQLMQSVSMSFNMDLKATPNDELSELIGQLNASVQYFSASLVDELALRDELIYERESKEKFLLLLSHVEKKKRELLLGNGCQGVGNYGSNKDSGKYMVGDNNNGESDTCAGQSVNKNSCGSSDCKAYPSNQNKNGFHGNKDVAELLAAGMMKLKRKMEAKMDEYKIKKSRKSYLTTIIPYDLTTNTITLQHIDAYNQILIAMSANNPTVPALLTDYILTVLCPHS